MQIRLDLQSVLANIGNDIPRNSAYQTSLGNKFVRHNAHAGDMVLQYNSEVVLAGK